MIIYISFWRKKNGNEQHNAKVRHAEFLKNLIGFLFICFNYSFKDWERQQLLKYDSLGDSELANCSNIGFSWKWNN